MRRRRSGAWRSAAGASSIVAAATVPALALVWTFGSLVARPSNHAVSPPDAPGRVVRFVTADGLRIEANHWPGVTPDQPAVLLLHGIGASRAMFDAHAAWLSGLGYAVLAPDLRGHGGSAAAPRSFGWYEAKDAAAALAFLRAAAPDRRVAIIGVSLGGAAALLAQNGANKADALVLQAVFPDIRTAIRNRIASRAGSLPAILAEPLLSHQSRLRFGVGPERISPIDALRRYRGPVLVIGGGRDRETPAADTRALHAAAAGQASLWLVAGADHPATCSLWNSAYRERVGRFLAAAIGEPPGRMTRGDVPTARMFSRPPAR